MHNFDHLYSTHYPKVRATIFRKVGNMEVADDLTQDTFIRVLAHVAKLDNHGNIEAYIFMTARSVVVDYLRSWKYRNDSQPELLEYGGAMMSDDIADDVSLAIDVRQTLSKLPPVERDVLVLHAVAGLKYDDIAAKHLKKSRHMAHYHLHWAKRHFAELYS